MSGIVQVGSNNSSQPDLHDSENSGSLPLGEGATNSYMSDDFINSLDVPIPSSEQTRLVMMSWSELVDGNLIVGDHIYRTLKSRDSTASNLFKRFPPDSQSRAFMIMLGYAIQKLDNIPHLMPSLIKLGRRHRVYNVQPEHYSSMKEAIMEVIADVLAIRFNSEMKLAWITVWDFIAKVMLKAQLEPSEREREHQEIKAPKTMDNLIITSSQILPEFEGWLEKMSSGKMKRFSRRWVELRGNHLFYFRDKTCPPSRVVDLSMGCSLQDFPQRPYSFTVITEKETYTFTAAGDIEKDAWWERIQRNIKASTKKEEEQEQVVFAGDPVPTVTVSDFDVIKVIGRGSYGKVFKVRQKDSGEVFALKALKKESIVHLAKYRDMELAAERNILQHIDHPFVVRLHHAFHTNKKLYLVMDFLSGGVLLWHMNNRRQQPSKGLDETNVSFYSAEVVSALQHLHRHGIIYRDLKPENLLLDRDGHVVLTDFGLATTKGTGIMMCGSAPFMAPEIIKRQPYTSSVDWWSLGVLIYEMMSGSRLFSGTADHNIFTKILSAPIKFPPYFSSQCKDLLKQMLVRDPSRRITGMGIQAHDFFQGLDWELLLQRKIQPPFIPSKEGSDMKYFNPVQESKSDVLGLEEAESIARASIDTVLQTPKAVLNLLEEFPHNSRIKVLPEEDFGRPIITKDGTVHDPEKLPYQSTSSFGIIHPPVVPPIPPISSPNTSFSAKVEPKFAPAPNTQPKPSPQQSVPEATSPVRQPSSNINKSWLLPLPQLAGLTLGGSSVMVALIGIGRFQKLTQEASTAEAM